MVFIVDNTGLGCFIRIRVILGVEQSAAGESRVDILFIPFSFFEWTVEDSVDVLRGGMLIIVRVETSETAAAIRSLTDLNLAPRTDHICY